MSLCGDIIGIENECNNIYGGFIKLVLAPREYLTGITVADGVVSSITLEDITASPVVSYTPEEYIVKQNKILYNTASDINFETNISTFDNSFTVHLGGTTAEQREAIMSAMQGQRELLVFALSDTGLWYLIGATDGVDGKIGVRVSEVTAEVTRERNGNNEFVVTFLASQDKELHLYVEGSVMDSLLNP